MERDEGNMYVLEAMLISLVLLGAAYGVQTLASTDTAPQERPRQQLTKIAADTLVVMDGLDLGNGSLLDTYFTEALHCAFDTEPDQDDCDIRRSENLSFRLEHYLPTGAGYAVALGNGIEERRIYESPLPRGEAVSASYTYTPDWNLTFMLTELSCYQSGMDVLVTSVPLRRANEAKVTYLNVTTGTLEVASTTSGTSRWWNATLPAGTRPAASDLYANVTGATSFNGTTRYGSCSLSGLGPTIVSATRSSTFEALAASVPIGGAVQLNADLGSLELLSASGVIIDHANVTIYEPIPGRRDAADTWIPVTTMTLPSTGARTVTWRPSADSFYGAHPAVMRAQIDVGGVKVEVRKLAFVEVGLASGPVPIDPPYRAILQAWFPEWG